MEYIAPLMQTALWVFLVGAIVWRFNKPIHGLLTALQYRIEAGSTVKVGPFEVLEGFRPQPPEEQRAKLLEEISESTDQTPEDLIANTQNSDAQGNAHNTVRLVGSYSRRPDAWLIAEDLALRAVQADYGQPIQRQMEFLSKTAVDGAFVLNGKLHLVEVKSLTPSTSVISLVEKIRKIADAVVSQHLSDAQIVLVLIIDRADYLASRDLQIREAVKDLPVPVAVRAYSVKELRKRFMGELGADES